MSEVDCGTRIIDQRSQHSGTGPDKHVYYHIGTYIRQNHCDICITMQYGSSLLQHWSSFCRVAGRYTVIVYADQRSSAGLCADDDDIDEGGCLSESACSADDPRSKVGMQCETTERWLSRGGTLLAYIKHLTGDDDPRRSCPGGAPAACGGRYGREVASTTCFRNSSRTSIVREHIYILCVVLGADDDYAQRSGPFPPASGDILIHSIYYTHIVITQYAPIKSSLSLSHSLLCVCMMYAYIIMCCYSVLAKLNIIMFLARLKVERSFRIIKIGEGAFTTIKLSRAKRLGGGLMSNNKNRPRGLLRDYHGVGKIRTRARNYFLNPISPVPR
ncbi:Uncharacterized protein FWK35_00015974 [Aphis craccivora]|uniref:Uncharacterized protein n=1 Tax=Aphis craccivora TaxID=307492 RepID=A0A6G0ZBV7_APHCR|nr:Uncharacterized protein FWK35_00015974 [Aphis craccivora]